MIRRKRRIFLPRRRRFGSQQYRYECKVKFSHIFGHTTDVLDKHLGKFLVHQLKVDNISNSKIKKTYLLRIYILAIHQKNIYIGTLCRLKLMLQSL